MLRTGVRSAVCGLLVAACLVGMGLAGCAQRPSGYDALASDSPSLKLRSSVQGRPGGQLGRWDVDDGRQVLLQRHRYWVGGGFGEYHYEHSFDVWLDGREGERLSCSTESELASDPLLRCWTPDVSPPATFEMAPNQPGCRLRDTTTGGMIATLGRSECFEGEPVTRSGRYRIQYTHLKNFSPGNEVTWFDAQGRPVQASASSPAMMVQRMKLYRDGPLQPDEAVLLLHAIALHEWIDGINP